MEGWRVGGLEGWRVGGLEGWRVGGLEGWRVGGLEGWRVGGGLGLVGWGGLVFFFGGGGGGFRVGVLIITSPISGAVWQVEKCFAFCAGSDAGNARIARGFF